MHIRLPTGYLVSELFVPHSPPVPAHLPWDTKKGLEWKWVFVWEGSSMKCLPSLRTQAEKVRGKCGQWVLLHGGLLCCGVPPATLKPAFQRHWRQTPSNNITQNKGTWGNGAEAGAAYNSRQKPNINLSHFSVLVLSTSLTSHLHDQHLQVVFAELCLPSRALLWPIIHGMHHRGLQFESQIQHFLSLLQGFSTAKA